MDWGGLYCSLFVLVFWTSEWGSRYIKGFYFMAFVSWAGCLTEVLDVGWAGVICMSSCYEA